MENVINLDRSQRLDIICRKGDTFILNLEIKNDSSDPANLFETTNVYTFVMEVRLSDTSATALLTPVVTVSQTTAGLVTFSVPAETMIVNSGLYVYDIQQTRTDTSSSEAAVLAVETLIYGTFKINEDVTV